MFDDLDTRYLILNVFGTAAIFLNTYLLYLIVKKSPRLLRKGYKILMMFICFWELIYTFSYLYLHPICYAFNFVYFTFVTLQNRWLPDDVINALLALYFGCFGVFQTAFTLQFMYRYWSMKQLTLCKALESWKMVLWLIIPVLVGCSSALNFYMHLGPTLEKTDMIREDMMSQFHLSTSEYTYISIIYNNNSTSNGTMNQLRQNIPVIKNVILAVILLIYSVKCYTAVRSLSLSTSSAEFNSMNSQLFYALVAQTAIPLLFISLPSYIIFVFRARQSNVKVLADVVFFMSSLFPVIDPIPNFLIVRSYREAVFGAVRRAFKRSSVGPVES